MSAHFSATIHTRHTSLTIQFLKIFHLFLISNIRTVKLINLIVITILRGQMADPTLLGSSKVTTRGQITIPQDIRDKFNISPGEKVYFLEENGKLLIRKGPIQLSPATVKTE